jgi:hypothetical protein
MLMSTGVWLSSALSGGAVLISVVALVVTWIGAQRGARTQLTELVKNLSAQVIVYEQLEPSSDGRFAAAEEIELSVRQADYLVGQLLNRVPDSVCTVVARALEAVADSWRADHYWKLAVAKATDDYYRARNTSLWGTFLFNRGDRGGGVTLMQKAIDELQATSVDAAVIRGDVYRSWASLVQAQSASAASELRDKARAEYRQIPATDERQGWYLGFTDQDAAAQTPVAAAPSEPRRTAR